MAGIYSDDVTIEKHITILSIIDALVQEIKASPRQPGADEIRIPFERAARERARRSIEGIVIDCRIVDELNAL